MEKEVQQQGVRQPDWVLREEEGRWGDGDGEGCDREVRQDSVDRWLIRTDG